MGLFLENDRLKPLSLFVFCYIHTIGLAQENIPHDCF
jgi:hypothetical protein